MKIFKYELDHEIEMPQGAQVLSVGWQQNGIVNGVYLWALVDPDAELEKRRFAIIGTGHEFSEEDAAHLGTVHSLTPQGANLVLHIFEVAPNA